MVNELTLGIHFGRYPSFTRWAGRYEENLGQRRPICEL